MSTPDRSSPIVFAVFVMMTFYGLGAGYLESFVNYPTWPIVGATDQWVAYHKALGARVIVVLAIPALVLTLGANVLLFFWRPAAVPRWAVLAALIMLVVPVVSTMVIQIPIQIQLDRGYDQAALERLIVTSFWLRDLPGGVRAAFVGGLMIRALAHTATPIEARMADTV